MVFLDARPVFKVHVLVIPRLHYPTLADLPTELTGPLFARVRQLSTAMAAAPGTDGSFSFNTTAHRASSDPGQMRIPISPRPIRGEAAAAAFGVG